MDGAHTGLDKMIEVKLRVNGTQHQISIEPRYLLSDVLRDQLGLTGLHLGCEQGVCGACTVLIDGEPAVSCLTLASEVGDAAIQTVEQLSRSETGLNELEAAFIKHGAFQCGFCTPGFLAVGHYILDNGLATDPAAVREQLSGNICRCTGFEPIVDAIMDVARNTNKP